MRRVISQGQWRAFTMVYVLIPLQCDSGFSHVLLDWWVFLQSASFFHKQNIRWNMSCILLSSFDGWGEMGRHEGGVAGSDFFSFFFLLSWKNCCIASAHSDSNTPRLMVIFGWNGCTGGSGLPVPSEAVAPSPIGKSLKQKQREMNSLDSVLNRGQVTKSACKP